MLTRRSQILSCVNAFNFFYFLFPFQVSNSEFITTATQEGHGACTGDSGGPVVTERNGLWYLEGVTSWGPSICGHPGYYNGQADVRAVLQWIKDTIKNN